MRIHFGPVWLIDWQVDEELRGEISVQQYAAMAIDTESDTCVECVELEGTVVYDIQSVPFFRKDNRCSVYVTTKDTLESKLKDILKNHYKFPEDSIAEVIISIFDGLEISINTVDFDPRNN